MLTDMLTQLALVACLQAGDIDALVRQLSLKDEELRKSAEVTLERLGPRALPALRTAKRDDLVARIEASGKLVATLLKRLASAVESEQAEADAELIALGAVGWLEASREAASEAASEDLKWRIDDVLAYFRAGVFRTRFARKQSLVARAGDL